MSEAMAVRARMLLPQLTPSLERPFRNQILCNGQGITRASPNGSDAVAVSAITGMSPLKNDKRS